MIRPPFGLGRDLEVTREGGGTPMRSCDALQPQFKSRLLQRLHRGP